MRYYANVDDVENSVLGFAHPTTRRHIAQDLNLQLHRCENLESRVYYR